MHDPPHFVDRRETKKRGTIEINQTGHSHAQVKRVGIKIHDKKEDRD